MLDDLDRLSPWVTWQQWPVWCVLSASTDPAGSGIADDEEPLVGLPQTQVARSGPGEQMTCHSASPSGTIWASWSCSSTV